MSEKVKVWDPGIRIFHWGLVLFFVVAYVSGEDEQGNLHAYTGYIVGGLIIFRILWGFVGPQHARFVEFVRGPLKTSAYIRSLITGRPQYYLGHNPLGAWMVLTLLFTISLAVWSGLVLYGHGGKGPLASGTAIVSLAYANGKEHGRDEHEGDEVWEELHEASSNLTVLLISMHILGVLLTSLIHRENLVRAMITGYKHVKVAEQIEESED